EAFVFQVSFSLDLNDLDFHPNSPDHGFVVGTNLVRKIHFNGINNPSVSNTPNGAVSLPANTWNSVHAFSNGNAIVVGGSKVYLFKNGSWAEEANPPSNFTSPNITDVFFRDDYNGYIVGSYTVGSA